MEQKGIVWIFMEKSLCSQLPLFRKFRCPSGSRKWHLCFESISETVGALLKQAIHRKGKLYDKSRHYIIENPFISFSKCTDRLLTLFLWSLDLVISLKLNCSLRNLSQRYCGYLFLFLAYHLLSHCSQGLRQESNWRVHQICWGGLNCRFFFFSRYTVSDPNETPYFYFILCCFIFPLSYVVI